MVTQWMLGVLLAVAAGDAGLPNGSWQVDVKRSRVFIHVYATGFGHEHGVSGWFRQGFLEVGNGEVRGKWEFDLRRFHADDPAARRAVGLSPHVGDSEQRQVTAIMLGPDVLDVAHHPTAWFEVVGAERLRRVPRGWEGADAVLRLSGRFSLHGVTRPLSFLVGTYRDREGFELRGVVRIRQSEYGIRPYRRLFGAVGVADPLDIYGRVVFVPSRAQAKGGRSGD